MGLAHPEPQDGRYDLRLVDDHNDTPAPAAQPSVADRTLQLRIGDETVTSELECASSRWARMKGLLGRKGLAPTEGLWITPCNAIHMWFMRFPIDVVFLDEQLSVVRVHHDVPPWAMRKGGKFAHSVLELPAGRAGFFNIRVGDRVSIGE